MKTLINQYNRKLFTTSNKIRRKLPAIVSDIDGVVYRGGSEIGNSRKVISWVLNSKPF